MKNTTELRDELLSVFADLKTRKIDIQSAKAMVAVSNVIIKTAAEEASYNKFLCRKVEIEFLKTPQK